MEIQRAYVRFLTRLVIGVSSLMWLGPRLLAKDLAKDQEVKLAASLTLRVSVADGIDTDTLTRSVSEAWAGVAVFFCYALDDRLEYNRLGNKFRRGVLSVRYAMLEGMR